MDPRLGDRTGGPGEDLEVEAQDPLGLGDDLRERGAEQVTHPPHPVTQVQQPLPAEGCQRAPATGHPPGRRQVVHGLDEAHLVLVGVHPRPQRAGPVVQRREVARAEAHRRPGEEAGEVVAAGGVVDDVQEGHQVDDLGHGEQSPEADHLARHPAGLKGLQDDGELRALAAQDRRRGPAPGRPRP